MGGGSFFVRLLASRVFLMPENDDISFFLFYFIRTSDPTTSQCALWGNISTGVKPSAR